MFLISIKGIDKAKLLQYLFNNAGTSRFFQVYGKDFRMRINYVHARELCKERLQFTILYCKSLHIDISADQFDISPYEREHCMGNINKVIDDINNLRKS